ncbi:MAG: aspartyl protease family protein [Mariniphaga sp.]
MQEILVEIVELEENTYHPLVQAEFPGLDNYWWVVDTGASKSVFDETMTNCYLIDNDEHVMATGLGKEMVETNSGRILQFKLSGTNFGELKVALIDFIHINNEYAKFSDKRIIGLIGSDFLFTQNAIIDFQNKKITLPGR